MNQPSARPLLPPRYINVPVPLAYAPGNEPAILTLIRIVGLCWEQGGRCTPALSRESLGSALQREPRTLRRHLADLQALGWLQIDRHNDAYILRPRIGRLPPIVPAWDPSLSTPPPAVPTQAPPDPALRQALAEVGIENPVRDELACEPGLDPVWVRAWHLWTQHPQRAGLENPAGFLVRQLRAGHAPPDPYLQMVTLTEEQITQLRVSCWNGDQDLDDALCALRPTFLELFPEG